MAYDDIADAESLDDEYDDYEDDYDDDEEEDLLFGRIPRTPGLIAIFSLLVVILLLLAALVSTSFGFRSGITYLDVTINANEDDFESTKIEVSGLTGTPSFGKNADGKGDLVILYDDQEVYSTKMKFNDGQGKKSIAYSSFYVDNGDYTAQVDFEGKTSEDTITVRRTAHSAIIAQRNFTTGYKTDDEDTRKGEVVYKLSLFSDEDKQDFEDIIYTIGTAELQIYYVDDEEEQENRKEWEEVALIDITTDFSTYLYQYPGESEENRSVELGGYQLQFDQDDIMSSHGEGYYTVEVTYINDYGLEEFGAFTGPIEPLPLPEDSYNDEDGTQESYEWLFLEEFD